MPAATSIFLEFMGAVNEVCSDIRIYNLHYRILKVHWWTWFFCWSWWCTTKWKAPALGKNPTITLFQPVINTTTTKLFLMLLLQNSFQWVDDATRFAVRRTALVNMWPLLSYRYLQKQTATIFPGKTLNLLEQWV